MSRARVTAAIMMGKTPFVRLSTNWHQESWWGELAGNPPLVPDPGHHLLCANQGFHRKVAVAPSDFRVRVELQEFLEFLLGNFPRHSGCRLGIGSVYRAASRRDSCGARLLTWLTGRVASLPPVLAALLPQEAQCCAHHGSVFSGDLPLVPLNLDALDERLVQQLVDLLVRVRQGRREPHGQDSLGFEEAHHVFWQSAGRRHVGQLGRPGAHVRAG